MKRRTMKELPYSDRPYEKCLASGPESLTDAELLSVILRTGARGESSLELSKQILELSYPADSGTSSSFPARTDGSQGDWQGKRN